MTDVTSSSRLTGDACGHDDAVGAYDELGKRIPFVVKLADYSVEDGLNLSVRAVRADAETAADLPYAGRVDEQLAVHGEHARQACSTPAQVHG